MAKKVQQPASKKTSFSFDLSKKGNGSIGSHDPGWKLPRNILLSELSGSDISGKSDKARLQVLTLKTGGEGPNNFKLSTFGGFSGDFIIDIVGDSFENGTITLDVYTQP